MHLLSTNRILSLFVVVATTNLVYGVPIEAEQAHEQALPRNLEGEFGISKEFDYVIVGGGTAGLTLANRLSEDPSISVAVVEAGSFYQITNPLLGKTPVGDVLFVGSDPSDTNPLVDWNFVTEPQRGANGRKIHYARGKCLGGRYVTHLGDLGISKKWLMTVQLSKKLHDLPAGYRPVLPEMGRGRR